MSGPGPPDVTSAYGFWGMGFVLYPMIVTMLHHRFLVHPLPHAALAPSLWIGLGPIGVGALAPVKMATAGTSAFGPSASAIDLLSRLAATALWVCCNVRRWSLPLTRRAPSSW